MWHWFFSASFIIGVILIIIGLIGAFVGCNNKKEIHGHHHDDDIECNKYGCTKNKVPGWAWVLLIIGIVLVLMALVFLIVSWVNPSTVKIEEKVNVVVKEHFQCPRPCCASTPVAVAQNCCPKPPPQVVHVTQPVVEHTETVVHTHTPGQVMHHHHTGGSMVDRTMMPPAY